MQKLAIGSDNLVTLATLTDTDGNVVSKATVTFTLTNAAGQSVVASTPMPIANAAVGRYSGILPHTTTLTAGAEYYLTITATYGSIQVMWREICKAAYLTRN